MLVKAFFMSVIRSQDVPRGAPSALALARLPRRRRERRRAIRARGGGRAGDRGADGKAGAESVCASMPRVYPNAAARKQDERAGGGGECERRYRETSAQLDTRGNSPMH